VIEIHEDIGGKHPVRARAKVTKFDDEAFNFDLLLGGLFRVGSLDHLYADVEGGCSFYTEARVGVRVPIIGRLLNWIIRRQFTEELLRDWIVHNVEESGETEKFVPALFEEAQRDSAGPSTRCGGVIDRIKAARSRRPSVTTEEILAARDEGSRF